ncbi:hypothetical protein [Allobranchiibius sp. GilTou38]|uniref:hypothetical protein n=1 Tax=Allobranchiibius sp. GilTou38 TaxID=2815210 RepID=UPI001AA0B5F2|nr:hypothetical protein [Allobranchiibius sp. GilTou38]MBO1767009.1 hypothetical protein [Allobranchiibius sp. GilTou38]
MTRRLRAGRSVLGALGLATSVSLLSGCMYLSPTQTDVSYNGSNGTNATVGDLTLSGVLISASSKGAPGTMQGMVTNNSDSTIAVTVAVGGSQAKLSVPADTAVRLDGQPSGNSTSTVSAVKVASTPAAPGAKTTVIFATASSGQSPVVVPVLLPGQAYN